MKIIEFSMNNPELKMVKYDDGRIDYWVDDCLIDDDGWGVYLKVDRKTFIEAFEKFAWVPKECWCKEVVDKYNELSKELII